MYIAAGGGKENDVVSGVERRVLCDVLRADVVVRDLEEVERLTPPALGLSVLPRVEQRDARRAQRVELDVRRHRRRRVRLDSQLTR